MKDRIDKILVATEKASSRSQARLLIKEGVVYQNKTQINKTGLLVEGIDVGHEQLSTSLKNDPRIINMEGINIRNPLALETKEDMEVCDLSFISLKLVLQNIFNLVKKDGKIITLF